MKTRRKFDAEFKLEIVRMVKDEDLSVPEIAKSMGVGETAIRRWVRQYDDEMNGGVGSGRPLTAEQQRIRQLESEVRQLRSDNELLKKRRPSLHGN